MTIAQEMVDLQFPNVPEVEKKPTPHDLAFPGTT
jgi:hypothetical protein